MDRKWKNHIENDRSSSFLHLDTPVKNAMLNFVDYDIPHNIDEKSYSILRKELKVVMNFINKRNINISKKNKK